MPARQHHNSLITPLHDQRDAPASGDGIFPPIPTSDLTVHVSSWRPDAATGPFDAPNTATVASTNKLLPCLCDRTADWHQLWPIFCVFSLVLAVVTAAVHGRRRTGAGSVLTADSKKKDDFF